jgi:hypothetical protein
MKTFQLTQTPNGFTIKSRSWNPIQVSLIPTHWLLQCQLWHGGTYQQPYGLFAFDLLIKDIGYGLVNTSKKQSGNGMAGGKCASHHRQASQASKEISETVIAECNRLLPNADPQTSTVQCAIQKSTSNECLLAMENAYLNQAPGLIQDVLHHPAAAIACQLFVPLALQSKGFAFLRSVSWDRLTPEQRSQNLLKSLNSNLPLCLSLKSRDVIELLENGWRNLFAPFDEMYAELETTLAALPQGIPVDLLSYLPTWRLCRPYFEKLELELVLQYAKSHTNIPNGFVLRNGEYGHYLHFPKQTSEEMERIDRLTNIIEQTTVHEIEEALSILSAFEDERQEDHSPIGTEKLVQFILDYPDPFQGTLVELVSAAIRWRKQVGSKYWIGRLNEDILSGPTPTMFCHTCDSDNHEVEMEMDMETDSLSILMGVLHPDLEKLSIRGENYQHFLDSAGDQSIVIQNESGLDNESPWNDNIPYQPGTVIF